jgi:hypothetical protein
VSERGASRLRLSGDELAWLGAAASALAMVVVVGLVAKPLSDFYPDADYPFYSGWSPPKHRPEPLEAVRFLLAIAFPAALAVLVLSLSSRGRGRQALELPVIGVQVALVVFVGLMFWRERTSIAFDYAIFEPSLIPPPNLVAAAVIGLAVTALALRWRSERLRGLREAVAGLGAAPAWAAALLAVIATFLWLLPGVITDAGIAEAGLIPLGHLPIEFDEFLAATNGRTPLVDYVPWYSSLTPIALSGWWPVFDLSITSFTVTMVVISGLALLAVYAAFRNLTGNAWSALALYVPFVAMALQPWDTDGAAREFNGSYYAIMPERYLGPFALVWLCARHLRRGSPPIWALYGVAGLAAFNNPEFGIPALVAVTVALPLGTKRSGPVGPWLRGAAAEAAGGLAGAVALACAVVLVRSGELPDPELFAYPSRLVREGYTASPMSLWGVHWILYVTYAAALLTAAVRHVNRSPDRVLTGLLAFAGAFGLLTGAYFAGRSLPWQLWGLFPAWGLALALLGLTAWRALRTARRDSLRRVAVGSFAALAGFGLMVASIDRFPLPWQQLDRITAAGDPPFDHLDQQRFIEERTEPGEQVLMLGWELEHRIAERAGVENVSPWLGAVVLLSANETRRAIDQLEEAGGMQAFVTIARSDFKAEDEAIAASVGRMLRERGYRIVSRDPASETVQWRRPG